jgi:CubicO group peptidase (beta-lactamase class C family)
MKMTNLRTRVLGLILVAAGALAARGDEVDDYVTAAMVRQHIPGLSLAIIRESKVTKLKGYGFASVELNVPANPETVYELASATKPFVAMSIMLLLQDGKLSLEDRVCQYVEGTPEAWHSITLRQLLSHTSGIKDYLERPEMTPFDLPPEKIVQIAASFPLNFAPGKKWAYSNTGYVLLGMVIQKVTGKPFSAFLSERVFQPLAMAATQHYEPGGIVSNRAVGYLWLGPGGMGNAEMFKYMMSNRGDAGVLSTVGDLAKWEAALASGRLLSSNNLEAMWSPVRLTDGSACNYGLGWFLKKVNGHRHVFHPGGSAGAATIISRYPDDHLTIILLSNGGRAYPEGLDLGIAQILIPGLMPPPEAIAPTLLESYSGYYNAYGQQLLKVTPVAHGLLLNDGGGLANVFLPLSPTNFVAEDADRGCVFWRSATGEVTGMTLRLGVDEMPVQRIGPSIQASNSRPDPDPELSRRIEGVLKAFAVGGHAVAEVAGVADIARKDYARGPASELSGIQSIAFLDSQDLSEHGIERHAGKVKRVLYYRMLTDSTTRYVLVYLTADNQVTDQDVLSAN